MARGSRSRASRAERRMQKERAAGALQHGLSVPTPLPKRAPVSAPSNARPSSHPPGRRSLALAAASSRTGMPLAVKLLGLGLGLLGLVYGLTLVRDRKPSSEPAAAHDTAPGAAVK